MTVKTHCACDAQTQPHDVLPDVCPDERPADRGILRELFRREAMKFDVVFKAEGIAARADHDPLTLLEPDEFVTGTATQGDGTLTVVTSYGREVGIAPDGWFSIQSGPEFPYVLAQGPGTEPEHPAGDADA
jgi:hypothetical protein